MIIYSFFILNFDNSIYDNKSLCKNSIIKHILDEVATTKFE